MALIRPALLAALVYLGYALPQKSGKPPFALMASKLVALLTRR